MSEPRIFISYSRSDEEWARKFAESLRDLGRDVWFDEWSVRLGDSLAEKLEEGLRHSDLVVFLIAPEAAERPNVMFELGAAVGMGKRVVAVVPEDLDPSRLPWPVRLRKFLVRRSPQEVAEELVAKAGNSH